MKNTSHDIPRPRSAASLVFLAVFAVILFAAFCSLGAWQIQRRAWKLDLISQVEARVHKPAAPAPGPSQWPALTAAADDYSHVTATGTLLYERETLVQATTDYGSGYWVMTPMQRREGGTVLINRGFVLPEWRKLPAEQRTGPSGEVTVTGLMRMSEPDYRFFRHNDPIGGFWYSRDTRAIAQASHLGEVAPYFIDAASLAQAKPDPALTPVGGLTVINFPNNHLSYIITWFAMAAMVIAGVVIVWRDERRTRRQAAQAA